MTDKAKGWWMVGGGEGAAGNPDTLPNRKLMRFLASISEHVNPSPGLTLAAPN